jgi:hypothetical protein
LSTVTDARGRRRTRLFRDSLSSRRRARAAKTL